MIFNLTSSSPSTSKYVQFLFMLVRISFGIPTKYCNKYHAFLNLKSSYICLYPSMFNPISNLVLQNQEKLLKHQSMFHFRARSMEYDSDI